MYLSTILVTLGTILVNLKYYHTLVTTFVNQL